VVPPWIILRTREEGVQSRWELGLLTGALTRAMTREWLIELATLRAFRLRCPFIARASPNSYKRKDLQDFESFLGTMHPIVIS